MVEYETHTIRGVLFIKRIKNYEYPLRHKALEGALLGSVSGT